MPTPIDPKRIRTDLDTQSRVALNEDIVKEYAEAMKAGQKFPAPLVFYDEPKDEYILADGFHRHASHMRVKPNDPILVELRLGTVEDARWESIGANKSHGLRRTNEDKRNAVTQALIHPKGAELSDRRIAEHVGVSHTTVQNVRRDLESTGKICQSDSRTGQDGRTIKTNGINTTRKPHPPGATCAICCYFEKSTCLSDGSQPLPWTEACDEFEPKEELPPVRKHAPPDYDNIVVREDKPDRTAKSNSNPYRRLKGCETLHLPADNAQLFAVELRNRFSPDYLVACIAALKYLLTDNDD